MNAGEKSEIFVKLYLMKNQVLPIYSTNNEFLTTTRYTIKKIHNNITIGDNTVTLDSRQISVDMIEGMLDNVQESLINKHDVCESVLSNFKKAPSKSKSDITITADDNQSNKNNVDLSYSIKSYYNANPTLINSSKHTNIKYELFNCRDEIMEYCNLIEGRKKLIDKYDYLKKSNVRIEYNSIPSDAFHYNLKMVDTIFPELLANKLLESYSGGSKTISQLVSDELEIFKFIRFFEYFGLAAFPSEKWDGVILINGGFINVDKDLNVKVWDFIYEKNNILNKLFETLKFDSPSTKRYDMFNIKKEGNRYFMTLNVQIRHMSTK